MKKIPATKLKLRGETVRRLPKKELVTAVGGGNCAYSEFESGCKTPIVGQSLTD
jgi:hypothetical protein